MSDTHILDLYEEIRLSRALAREIHQIIAMYGAGIVPSNVYAAYARLQLVYQNQLEKEALNGN